MDETVKLTWEQWGKEISISAPAVTMDQVIEELVEPLLLAVGFQPETIKEYLHPEELSAPQGSEEAE